jgi:hypothetical protein
MEYEDDYMESTIFLDEIPEKFTVFTENTKLKIDLEFVEKPKIIELAKAYGDYINQNIIKYSPKIKNNASKEDLEEIKKEILEYEEQVTEIKDNISKLKRNERKILYPIVMDIFELLTNFHEILSSAYKNQISNDKIATLTSLAYKNITKKSIQKKLDKRVENNVVLFSNMDEKVSQLVEKMNFNEIREKYKNPSDFGSCMLSCLNWIECLEDEDCLCITLDVVVILFLTQNREEKNQLWILLESSLSLLIKQ